MGIISNFPRDEDALNALAMEMDELSKIGEKQSN